MQNRTLETSFFNIVSHTHIIVIRWFFSTNQWTQSSIVNKITDLKNVNCIIMLLIVKVQVNYLKSFTWEELGMWEECIML